MTDTDFATRLGAMIRNEIEAGGVGSAELLDTLSSAVGYITAIIHKGEADKINETLEKYTHQSFVAATNVAKRYKKG